MITFEWAGKKYELTERQYRPCKALKELGELSTLQLVNETYDTCIATTISQLRKKGLPISHPYKKKVNGKEVNYYQLLVF